jgi:hypothetical protein
MLSNHKSITEESTTKIIAGSETHNSNTARKGNNLIIKHYEMLNPKLRLNFKDKLSKKSTRNGRLVANLLKTQQFPCTDGYSDRYKPMGSVSYTKDYTR